MQIVGTIISYIKDHISAIAPANISLALANPTGLFALLVVVVTVLYGLSVGKTKALVSLLSIYVAYMLTVLFPFLPWLQEHITLPEKAPVLAPGLFAVFYIMSFLILSHSMMKHRLTLGETSITKVIIISIIQLGLMASITLSLLPPDFNTKTFGLVLPFLAGSRALWLWAAASLIIMPFMKGHRSRE